jgi:hypothetical protein
MKHPIAVERIHSPVLGGLEDQARSGGHELVVIDPEQLEKLCALQCTDAEIAAWFHVSTRTIENRRKQSNSFLPAEL